MPREENLHYIYQNVQFGSVTQQILDSVIPIDRIIDYQVPWNPKQKPVQQWSSLLKKPHQTVDRKALDVTKTSLIKPRGLINNGNMCFMNAILQPLIHTTPLYHLMQDKKHTTPIYLAMQEFCQEHEIDDGTDEPAPSFAPEYVYEAIRKKQPDTVKGRQEDAQEFLGFLLDGLHEELIGKSSVPKSQEDEWMQVGKKNKTVTARILDTGESFITQIFGGRIRSVVRASGQKDSVTHEPFLSLQLDIADKQVKDIQDALVKMTEPEVLEGFTTNGRSEATKQALFEMLPPMLIIHIKRFIYDSVGGTLKSHKHISYPHELTFNANILAKFTPPTTYQLVGVVYHHGKNAMGGHYTCDVKRQSGEWLRFDDTVVSAVEADQVIEEQLDRQPYMLFYSK
ncbi:ubiquitin carboxyl-terminal hydrolase 10 [Gorgonomyces haynaldii]|nr:ubiquitin carboxyl-terminal hydrolase 10 [Gorgonomyces haynaldii]